MRIHAGVELAGQTDGRQRQMLLVARRAILRAFVVHERLLRFERSLLQRGHRGFDRRPDQARVELIGERFTRHVHRSRPVRRFIDGSGGDQCPQNVRVTASSGEHERRLGRAQERVHRFASAEVGIRAVLEQQLHKRTVRLFGRGRPMQRRVTIPEAGDVGVRSMVEQPPGGCRAIRPRGLRERGAKTAGGVDVRTGLHEQLDDFQIAAKRRPHERTAPAAEDEARLIGGRLGVGIRPVCEQQAHGLGVAPRRGRHQGRAAKHGGRPGIRAVFQEQLDRALRIRRSRRKDQRGVAGS
jgi:hypothetical protein